MKPGLRQHITLLGPMASGKSTVGSLLAARLSRTFFDSDDQLEARGAGAVAIYKTLGRDALHAAEEKVLLEALEVRVPVVIAAAASVVDAPRARAALAATSTNIFLRADDRVLERRVNDGQSRPVAEDASSDLASLSSTRRGRYADLADLVVDVDGKSPAQLVEEIVEALSRRVEVALGDRSYPVIIGPGTLPRLRDVLPPSAKRAVIVTQEHIGVVVDPGIAATTLYIGDGESAKSIATVERLCRDFAQYGLSRADVVIAVGGGVVTDAAGFAAACYHRGVAYVNVSTTLLGQIDAAVGGKTAVNIPEGKNLVGAFWQPAAVICDTDTLRTLSEREWRSGLGEMAKYAFLGVSDLDKMSLVDAVSACVRLKAGFVADDEREGDRRMLLNYGHTLAHALEAAGFADGPGRDGVDLRHGEAVAIGIAFAARLAQNLGRIDEARVMRHLEVLASYGLPVEIPAGVDVEEVLVRMARDKKATDGLTFILDSDAGCEVVRQVADEPIRDAFSRSGPGSSIRAASEVA